MLQLVFLSALATSGPSHPVHTPWYLPRSAYLGMMINAEVAAPELRVGWELTFFDEPRNQLAFVLELGPSFAVAMPSGVKLFWEHVALGGLGYRWGRDAGFQWGFQLGAGPVLQGARFSDGSGEQRVLGFVEGRVYAGGRLGPMTLALGVGYGSSWNQNPYFVSAAWLGGFTVGLVLNWR